jgi:hypothetical protein
VVAGVRVGDDGAPKPGSENNGGKEKKDAGHFKPENAAHATEGTQKAADAAAYGTPGLAERLPSLSRSAGCGRDGGAGCRVAGGAVLIVGALGLGAGNRSGLMPLRSGGRGLRVALQELRGRAPGDAHSDAQGASNQARSHSVYDGSSGL